MQQVSEMLGSLGFNWHVALANFVNFLIILFILNRFVFKKISHTIAQREEVIKRGLDNSEKARVALNKIDDERKKVISHAEKEGHEIVNKAHTQAELLVVTIREQAEDEARKVLEEAKKKKEEARAEAQKEFANTAPKLVAELTAKALRESMTSGGNDNLIARASK